LTIDDLRLGPARGLDPARPSSLTVQSHSESSIVNRQSTIASAAPLSAVRSLVIVCPSWVGDTVMATPVLRAARQALPQATIIGVMRHGLDEVLAGTPWLDQIMVCDMKGVLGPWRLACAIKRQKPDAVLLLPNSFRSALAARLSGSPARFGYDRDWRGWLLTHKVPVKQGTKKVSDTLSVPIPMIDYYAALAAFAFDRDVVDRRLELASTELERRAADRLLHEVDRPFVLLNPGANRADKRWPAERFAAVADAMAALHGLAAVVSGSSHENHALEAVVRSARTPIVNIAQRGVTLGSLKAVLQRAALMITNDTGPRHMAAALGTPVVTLFGPTDHRWTTLHCAHERVLLAEPFLPEESIADRHRKACAIQKISVGDVIAAATGLLERAR
jgi:heptosyltransferase-2